MRLIRLMIAALVIAAIPLSTRPLATGAESVSQLQDILNAFLQNRSGGPENVTIAGSYTVVVPCPSGYRCTWTPVVTLAAFSEGDAAGQALFSNNSNCPNCFNVLAAAGGVFSLAEIENYGIDATTAQSLISGL